MKDPFGSMQGMMNQFRGFIQNPMQFMVQKKLNIPQEMMSNPDTAIQYLLNTGKITQQDYDWAVQQAKQIQNNPDFAKLLNNRQ
jgi:hypothetical protein